MNPEYTLSDELLPCSSCGVLGTVRYFTTWHDDDMREVRHCDTCAALTTCGLCSVEGNAQHYRTILQDGCFVMDVCSACDTGVC
jgi:hypothetical protein